MLIGTISNNYGSDVVIVPDAGQIYLVSAVNATNIIGNNITTPANKDLNITPGTNGSTYINSTLAVRDSLIISSGTLTANNNLNLSIGGQVQVASGKALATDILKTNTATAIAVKNNVTFDAGLTETVDNIVSKSISNTGDVTVNGNITAVKLQPYDGAGLTINLNTCTITCTITCADNVTNPALIVNPALQLNGTLACTAGMSLSGGDLMVWSKITTPYSGSATDLQLNPSGNVRVIGNKTLFCNAISQNDTNTDLYLTAGGTNQNVVISPAGMGQVQVLTGKTLSADNIVSKTISNNGNIVAVSLSPYDTAGLNINLNTCTLTCNHPVPNPQIIMSSPVLANVLTVNTINSGASANLTLNFSSGTMQLILQLQEHHH